VADAVLLDASGTADHKRMHQLNHTKP